MTQTRPLPPPEPPTVTESASEVGSSDPTSTPAEREIMPETGSEVTYRDVWSRIINGARAYMTPPSVWTDRPAPLAELRSYADSGTQLSRVDGPLRGLAVAWHVMVGLPTTVACRYVEWISQRFGRSVVVFLLWKMVIRSDPGHSLREYVLNPVGTVLAWVFL